VIDVSGVLDPAREMRDLAGGEDLPGASLTAEPGREVQRGAPVAPLDRNGLSGVEPDPHRERELRLLEGLLHEALLKVDGGADRLAGRGEHAEGLVPAQLEERSATRLDDLARDVGELRGELRRCLVAALLGEQGVPADVRDQERPDLGLGPSVVPVRVTRRVGVRHPRIMLHALRTRGTCTTRAPSGKYRAWPIAR